MLDHSFTISSFTIINVSKVTFFSPSASWNVGQPSASIRLHSKHQYKASLVNARIKLNATRQVSFGKLQITRNEFKNCLPGFTSLSVFRRHITSQRHHQGAGYISLVLASRFSSFLPPPQKHTYNQTGYSKLPQHVKVWIWCPEMNSVGVFSASPLFPRATRSLFWIRHLLKINE